MKNAASIDGAVILWILTIWIPYINVGTTIALCAIPVELSKGNVISPTFIFNARYRQFMGEYFSLLGLMMLAIWPAILFFIVPGIVIAIGWSLAIYLLIDKQISPTQAMIQSNKATNGYKWTIFGVQFVLMAAFYIVMYICGVIFNNLPAVNMLLMIILVVALQVISLGCSTVIYRNLTNDAQTDSQTETVEA